MKNYWSAGCASLPNVLTVPFGPRSGTAQTHAARWRWPRRYVWSFSSSHTTATRDAATMLLLRGTARHRSLKPYYLQYAAPAGAKVAGGHPSQKNPRDLGAVAYTNVTCDSAFALTPKGNVHDGRCSLRHRRHPQTALAWRRAWLLALLRSGP